MSSPHILVVDDEPDIRSLLKEILEDEGYDISVAENASEAPRRATPSSSRSHIVGYLDAGYRWY